MTGVGALSADGTKVVGADARAAASKKLGAQLCGIKAGNCSDAWADPVTPSQICSVVTGPGGIYAAGYEADGVNREAMLLKITVNGGAVRVNKFIPNFQIATGVRAEGYMVKVGQDNNIYLGSILTVHELLPAPVA